jgi:hypothetical protein
MESVFLVHRSYQIVLPAFKIQDFLLIQSDALAVEEYRNN